MTGHGNNGTLMEHMMDSGAPPGEEETHAVSARLPTMPRMPVETARVPGCADPGSHSHRLCRLRHPTGRSRASSQIASLPCEPHEMAVYAHRCPEIRINRRSWLDGPARCRHDGRDGLR
jgi:hypothetical protein